MDGSEIQRRQPTAMEMLDRLTREVKDPAAAIELGRQIVELDTKREELVQARERFEWEKGERAARVAFSEAFLEFKRRLPGS